MSTSSCILPRVACKAPAPAPAPSAPAFRAVRVIPTIRPSWRTNLTVRHSSVRGCAAEGNADDWENADDWDDLENPDDWDDLENAANWELVYGPRDLRETWGHIDSNKGKTFLVLISSEIVCSPHFADLLQYEISLFHRNGVKLVLVPSTRLLIHQLLEQRGNKAKYVGGYQVTDSDSLEAAREAAATIRYMVEAKLSPRKLLSHEPGVSVASGDFFEAEKRGVVEGIDFGATGGVKKINVRQIREGLERDSVVVVSNLGYSCTREVLSCNTYEVATACAIAIQAEKLICIVDGQIVDEQGQLVRFMTSEDADMITNNRTKHSEKGYFSELTAAARVCKAGVEKAHLVDGTSRGALLQELLTEDGNGTIISSGIDNGTRPATVADLLVIKKLMRPLDKSGALVRRTHLEFVESLGSFIILERDGSVVACASLIPFFWDKYGEVDLAMASETVGHDQGEKLLDHIEKKASSLGLEKLFLHTTCTSDWIVRRGFTECSSTSIPKESRRKVELTRG